MQRMLTSKRRCLVPCEHVAALSHCMHTSPGLFLQDVAAGTLLFPTTQEFFVLLPIWKFPQSKKQKLYSSSRIHSGAIFLNSSLWSNGTGWSFLCPKWLRPSDDIQRITKSKSYIHYLSQELHRYSSISISIYVYFLQEDSMTVLGKEQVKMCVLHTFLRCVYNRYCQYYYPPQCQGQSRLSVPRPGSLT